MIFDLITKAQAEMSELFIAFMSLIRSNQSVKAAVY